MNPATFKKLLPKISQDVNASYGLNYIAATSGDGIAVTVWANTSDHTQVFPHPNALLEWNVNMFASLLAFKTAGYYDSTVGYRPVDLISSSPGNYSESITLNLLDSSSSILKTASTSGGYAIGSSNQTTSVSASVITYDGNGPIRSFNAIKLTTSASGVITGGHQVSALTPSSLVSWILSPQSKVFFT